MYVFVLLKHYSVYIHSLNTETYGGYGRVVKRQFAFSNSYARAILVRKQPRVCIFAQCYIAVGEEIILSPAGDDGKVCTRLELFLIFHWGFNVRDTLLNNHQATSARAVRHMAYIVATVFNKTSLFSSQHFQILHEPNVSFKNCVS